MAKFVAASEETAPDGWVLMHVPGMQPAWVEPDLAAKLGELCSRGRCLEAKTILLWVGGSEEA